MSKGIDTKSTALKKADTGIIDDQKKKWIIPLEELRLTSGAIKDFLGHKYKFKKYSIAELIEKASLSELAEIYSEYRFAGKPSIYIHYVKSLKQYTAEELEITIKNWIFKKLSNIECIDLQDPFYVIKNGKYYIYFTNLKETIFVWENTTRRREQKIIPDFPVIVIEPGKPIVQIRTNVSSSLTICRDIVRHFMPKGEMLSCCFLDAKFRDKVLKSFEKATFIGLENVDGKGGTRKMTLQAQDNVLLLEAYSIEKSKGAVENFGYLVEDKESAVQINFSFDKLVFRKYSSEKKINDIMNKIIGIAEDVELFKTRTTISNILGKTT